MASSTLEIVIAARDQFTGTANRVIGSLNRMDSAAGRVGKGFGQLGTGLVRASAVGLTAVGTGLTFVAREAIKFEDAFAGVRKTIDESELAAAGLTFDDLARQFRNMATEIPIAATEFARIGETAGALGIAAKDVDDFTRTIALMGVTTNLTTDAAAEGMGKLGTILGLTGEGFEELADSIIALGNQGASTESEIVELSKRFAAAGRQAGLFKEDIVALASAAASLGIEPEAGGSALSRLFANMASDIALATDEGKAFGEITGKSLRDLEQQIRQGKALPVFMDFLKELKSMDRIQAARALQSVGITNVRDRDAVLKMAQNLEFVNEQLAISRTATGALGEEASKRFNTIASKLGLLKNNLIESTLLIGEGMLPAIGRATDKLIAFLKVPANQQDLKNLGEDIGEFIDGVDWDGLLADARSFVGLLKDAAVFAKDLLSVLAALPNEVKAAGLGLIGLNKLSGGLVGAGLSNIAGGLGETVARSAGSKLPGVGQLFAQPVFVTNWPVGFGAGGPGGGVGGRAGALGGLATGAALALPPIVLQPIVDEVQRPIAPDAFAHRDALTAPSRGPEGKMIWDLIGTQLKSLGGDKQVGQSVRELTAEVAKQGYVSTSHAQAMLKQQQTFNTQYTAGEANRMRGMEQSTAAIRAQTATLIGQGAARAGEAIAIVTAANATATAARDAASRTQAVLIGQGIARAGEAVRLALASREAGQTAAAAERASAARIVAAIRAINLDVNVSATTVVRTTAVQNRYGRQSGSRNTGRMAS